jgi:sec-independent protein translocase protein TatA
MFGLRGQELIIILMIILILFGSSKIPQMMKGLGQGLKEFKKGMKEDDKPEAKQEETNAVNKVEVAKPAESNVSEVKDISKN